MKNDFCVFILSHGRSENVVTYRTLKKCGYTGEIFLIIDNTDKQIDDYKKKFKNVVVFNKKERMQITDTIDNFQKPNAVVYARNECFKIAKDLGYTYFIVLDDDYTSFEYRFDKDLFYKYSPINNLDKIFSLIFEFYKKTEILSIAFAQGGDFIGGEESAFADKIYLKRKCMNSFFCSTEREFSFLGTINEDVNAYVVVGSRGGLFFTTNFISLNQKITQSNSGGLTDIYLNLGTYIKSFYSVICSPSCVKISTMGNIDKRIHHKISWDNAVPKILRPTNKKEFVNGQ